jgi:hypothetical protein
MKEDGKAPVVFALTFLNASLATQTNDRPNNRKM